MKSFQRGGGGGRGKPSFRGGGNKSRGGARGGSNAPAKTKKAVLSKPWDIYNPFPAGSKYIDIFEICCDFNEGDGCPQTMNPSTRRCSNNVFLHVCNKKVLSEDGHTRPCGGPHKVSEHPA